MTECERIVQNGILPESYFQEETICDFFVSKRRKQIWAIATDLLVELDRVCRKYNLEYFLMYGSLLGAKRHNGFIPWDDDIDVAMFRDDYNKLISHSDEFKNPYFFQIPQTDPEYFFSFAKVRNINTSHINSMFMYRNYCFGVEIDIYPIDNWVSEGADERYKMIDYWNRDLSTWMRMNNPNLSLQDRDRIKSWSGQSPLAVHNKIQEIASQFNSVRTEYVATAVTTVYSWERTTFKRSWFEKTLDFEYYGHIFTYPFAWEKILKTSYENWQKYPSVENRGKWHANNFFNPDVSYLEFIDECKHAYEGSINKQFTDMYCFF